MRIGVVQFIVSKVLFVLTAFALIMSLCSQVTIAHARYKSFVISWTDTTNLEYPVVYVSGRVLSTSIETKNCNSAEQFPRSAGGLEYVRVLGDG